MSKDLNQKIYVAGHRGMVGSAIVRNLQALGYTNIVTRSHAELDLTNQQSVKTFFEQEKPDQVYLHNTNLLHIVAPENINHKNLRMTFFYNQVGYQHKVTSSHDLDFKVNDKYVFGVGGKYTQAEGENRFAAADMLEIGEGHVIPLWLFGFLY